MKSFLCMFLFLLTSLQGIAQEKNSAIAKGNCAVSIIGDHNFVSNKYCGMSPAEVERMIRRLIKEEGGDVEDWRRTLVPGSEPTPTNACTPHLPSKLDHGMLVIAGSGASYCTKESCTVVAARSLSSKERVPLIWSRRDKNLLLLSARIFDERGELIAKLDDGKPDRNPAAIWQTPDRPDPHTILFKDNRDRPLFLVRLLNPSTVYVEGTLYAPDGDKVARSAVITPTGMHIYLRGQEMGTIGGFCSQDAGGSAVGF